MQFFQSAHSFLAPDNTLGFGIGDLVELGLVALVVAALQLRRGCEWLTAALAQRTTVAMLALAALPVVLRVALLPHDPIPTPHVYDEFSHLLVADTLRHFRLANPPHALHQFFETFFVLQRPSYSSIYPIGQGAVLAIGWALFGNPWAGVVLSVACFCALAYWMLRAWISPGWALIGGLFAVIEFGPLNGWMNSYWGGAVTAIAGCLVFGALPRLREHARRRDAVLLGAGLGIHLLTRPFESVFLLVSVVLFFLPELWRARKASAETSLGAAGKSACATVIIAVLPAIVLILAQNKEVTGNWTELPYQLSQYQYGVPMSLTFLPNPTPHLPLTREQHLAYISQRSYHGEGRDTVTKFFARLEYRARFYRFFFLAPLYLVFAIFIFTIREYRFAWVAITFVLFALGTNLFPYFYPRYIAAETPLFLLASVVGLERLSRFTVRDREVGRDASAVLVSLCFAIFAFWYTIHFFENGDRSPDSRTVISRQLHNLPGKQLVFVKYSPHHIFQDEWVYNRADIDAAHVVWARDLGAGEDSKLQHYYPDRTYWLLDADAEPPMLMRYQPKMQATPFADVP